MATDGRIAWTEEKRKLGDLLAWPNNPRQIDRKQAKRLVESFDEFGQVETMAIGPANELYNGHQRLNVLMEQYGPAYEVDVRVASRALTEREREKLTIYLHKGAAGTWDFDILADRFEQDDLLAWGFEPFELGLDEDEKTEDAPAGVDVVPQQWAIMIECSTESEQAELLQRFDAEGLQCRALIS